LKWCANLSGSKILNISKLFVLGMVSEMNSSRSFFNRGCKASWSLLLSGWCCIESVYILELCFHLLLSCVWFYLLSDNGVNFYEATMNNKKQSSHINQYHSYQ
jgi:hypothetical protein